MDDAELVTLEPGERREEASCFLAVLKGRVVILDTTRADRARVHTTLDAGDTFGETDLIRGEHPNHVIVAQQRSLLVVFHERGLTSLPPHLTLELKNAFEDLEGAAPFTPTTQPPTLVLLSGGPGIDSAAVHGLSELLGRAIEADFEEPVAVVTRGPDGWRVRYATHGAADGAAAPSWAEAVAALPQPDYVLVSLGRERAPHRGHSDADAVQPDLHVILGLPDQPGDLDAPPEESVLRTVLLDPHASRKTKAGTLDLRPYGDARKRSCRLMMSPASLRSVAHHTGPLPMQALLREHRETVSRWARFVTRRTVAVALGGGGAWGYFHVALLKEMLGRGVPIDLTSGTSFGALVSVYFAAKGEEGLDLLVHRGRGLSFTQALSVVSTHPLERQIGRDLDDADLTRLPIAANPFATNLTRVQGEAAWAGPAALGARASSSAPGLFGPTVLPDHGIFVDGVVAGNVPSAVLISQGADLLVSSNVVPRPPAKAVPSSFFGRVVSTVSPLDRVYEAYLSALFFLYAQGADHPGLGCITVQGNDALESMQQRPLPSDFERASAIVQHALQHDSVRHAADEIRSEWDRRRKRRVR
ncbi:MAG: patatin-like phospholipase family protein [Myxococcales bacterium]|nr:patatin-like phospholipase family protein [Myxococcales bacterium]